MAATVPAGITETVIPTPNGNNWSDGVGITFENNGRMYAWERTGRLWFKDPTDASFTQLLDISEEVGAWEDHGLLGFALDPNFRVNGNIYLLYVVDRYYLLNYGTPGYNPNSNQYYDATIGRLTRYTCRSSDGFRSVDPASRFILIGATKESGFPVLSVTHGVGSLVFGQDGTLMLSCGDGGSPAAADNGGNQYNSYAVQGLADGIIRPKEDVGDFRAQLVDCLNGKVLRIDPATGNGLPSNPFYDAANPNSARSRVWTLGLRNPFRMSLRPESGSHDAADGNPGVLYLGDVGWDTWESLRVVTGLGQNFGWPLYEGLDPHPNFINDFTTNYDAPNPSYPTNGCSQYFSFKDLLHEDTLSPTGQPPFANPCTPSNNIPSSIPQFLRKRPVLDWNHSGAVTRTPYYDPSGQAQRTNVGVAGSPVSGTQFQGNCAIGGTWYTGTNLPAAYQNRYFFADWGQGVIKTLTFDANNKPLALADFASNAGAMVCMVQHPVDGSIFYVSYDRNASVIHQLSYTGNRTPVAVASADQYYGPTPLTVQLSSTGSFDPDGQPISYSWNFGDGSPASTNANPSHTFTATTNVPTKRIVTLTVTDSGGLSAQATLIVSVNNTPPNVTITSPVDGSLFSPTNPTLVNLTATVNDAQSSDSQLLYQWQVLLHHNDHNHGSPADTNHVTTAVISPTGCDGINIYYYRVLLTVTDPAGLATTREVRLYPNCGANTPPVISTVSDQTAYKNLTSSPIPFTIGDTEVAAANLQLSAMSSNQALVPNGNIIFGGSGSNRTVTLKPLSDLTGTTTITLTVNDGPNNTSTSFNLSVIPEPLVNPPGFAAESNFAIEGPSSRTVNGATLSLNVSRASPVLLAAWHAEFDAGARNSWRVECNGVSGTLITDTNGYTGGDGNRRFRTYYWLNPAPGLNTVLVTNDLAAGDNELAACAILLTNVAQTTTLRAIGLDVSTNNRTAESETVATTTSDLVVHVMADALLTRGTLGAGETSRSVANDGKHPVDGDASIWISTKPGEAGSTTVSSSGWASRVLNGVAIVLHGSGSAVPTISAIPDQATTINTARVGIPFSINDADTAVNALILSAGSSNPALVPTNNIVFGGNDGNRTLTVTPATNQTGGATITISVSDGTNSASTAFLLTVTGVNTPPNITGIADQTIDEDTSTATLGFTIEDAETVADSLIVGKASSNPTLVPTGNIVLGGSGADRTVTVSPATNQNGATTITVSVNDGQFVVSTNFMVTVNAVNDPPTITGIANQSVNMNGATGPLSFTIGDVDTPIGNLTLSQNSSNPILVPTNNIVFGGSGANRTVSVTPLSNRVGIATITLKVSDGQTNTSTSFSIAVNSFVVGAKSFTNLVPIAIPDSGAATPYPSTLNVTGLAGTNSEVKVTLRNLSHTSSTDINALLVGPTGRKVLAISHAGSGLINNATLTLVDSAVAVLPSSGSITSGSYQPTNYPPAVAFPSPAPVSPYANSMSTFNGQSPNGTWSLYLYDDKLLNSGTLLGGWSLTVSTVSLSGAPPTISDIPDQSTTMNTPTAAIPFVINDTDTPVNNLTLSSYSSNEALVPTNNIVFGGSGSSRTVTLTPAAGQTGSAVIAVIVSDGTNTAGDTFNLIVDAGNTPPTLAPISDRVLSVGQVLLFTNSASDTDTPPQTLIYSLLSSPAGAALNATSGVFNWRPAVGQADTTNSIQVKVADNGSPVMSATQSFIVTLHPLARPALSPLGLTNSRLNLLVTGDNGPDYTIQGSTNLSIWTSLFSTNSPTMPFIWSVTNTGDFSQRFFRVLIGP